MITAKKSGNSPSPPLPKRTILTTRDRTHVHVPDISKRTRQLLINHDTRTEKKIPPPKRRSAQMSRAPSRIGPSKMFSLMKHSYIGPSTMNSRIGPSKMLDQPKSRILNPKLCFLTLLLQKGTQRHPPSFLRILHTRLNRRWCRKPHSISLSVQRSLDLRPSPYAT